ncbi:hypothetical protein CR513_09826, partial [Mucuna pruriens]
MTKQGSKLRSRWNEPFVITNVFPYGAIELKDENTNNTFQVNGHQIKLYHEGPAPIVGDMETISLVVQAEFMPTPTPSWPDLDQLRLGLTNFNSHLGRKEANKKSLQNEPQYPGMSLILTNLLPIAPLFPTPIKRVSTQVSRPGQTDSFPDRPTLWSNSPIRSGLLHCPCRQPSSGATTTSSQLNCHVTLEEACSASYARHRSRTKRSKVVRGDFLACHRTLVDLILSALANRALSRDRVGYGSAMSISDQSLPRATRHLAESESAFYT